MKRIYFIFLLLMATTCFGQTTRKISAFLSLQVNKTIYDRTITNNTGGAGLGLQLNVNTHSVVKPTIEVNADLFGGTKELYVTTNGKPIDSKEDVAGIYIGALFQPAERIFITTTLGTSLYNSKAHFGIRPSLGAYLSKNKKSFAKLSFTNIFQRDEISNKGFGYVSFGLAVKLF